MEKEETHQIAEGGIQHKEDEAVDKDHEGDEDKGEGQSGKRKEFFKQKVAIFFGYNGKAYKGLQKQKYDDNYTGIQLIDLQQNLALRQLFVNQHSFRTTITET